ncbi:MAG: CocE/NonD family hydrolase [Xanthomonadales bacterium]|nr:CocE/NonD family hydrolase [Xanthomonadales bacterium]
MTTRTHTLPGRSLPSTCFHGLLVLLLLTTGLAWPGLDIRAEVTADSATAAAPETAEPAAAQTANPVIRTEWISMPDGVRLSVDLYVPEDMQAGDRHPVLLEYLPYRKMESRSSRFGFYSYFVAQGYVVARVDIRGTGESEGKLVAYEYTEQEQADGEAVIDWLSKQSWSSGKVGMFGISWGGFNSIQMAMRNPPALKAIIAVDATDDIYEDDVHFTDGIMHADSYEMRQDIENAIPGAPAYLVDDAYFANRFDTEPWFLVYKRQQRDGPFWDRASLIGRYETIRIPTYVVGGWYDGYRDSIPRMLQHMKAPVKALLGPWSHTWPNQPFPGAGFEWRADAVRWFDHWLKGADNGVMEEPAFTVFIRDWHPPGLKVEEIPGQWRSEAGWPLQSTNNEVLYLQADHGLAAEPPQAASHQLLYKPDVGVEAAGSVMWWGDLQEDQRAVDAFSLVYETPPLQQAVTILGFPEVSLRASTDAPLAHWIARLADVAPDGRVTLITGAALNGAHRNSAEHPEALVPGETVDLDIEMHFTSWVFPTGHRIRLAVNNSMWPMFWPTPHAMTTMLEVGGEAGTNGLSRLVLPLLPPATLPPPVFTQEPTVDPSPPGFGESTAETESGYAEISKVTHDFRADTTRLLATNSGTTAYPWGSEHYSDYLEHFVSVVDPAHAGVNSEYSNEVVLDGRVLKWTGLFEFTSDTGFFYYRYTRRLEQDGKTIREKHWEEAIPRDFN